MKTPTQEIYDSLEFAYNHFNRYLFGNALPSVVFTAREISKRNGIVLGYYSQNRWINESGEKKDEIAINFRAVGKVSVIALLQTLTHEMCHAYQALFGTPSRRTYHNLEFAAVMESVGLITTDTGKVGGARSGQYVTQYPLSGGPFVYACMKLMFEEDFKIPWLDVRQVHRAIDEIPDINELLKLPEDFEPLNHKNAGVPEVNSSVFILKSDSENLGEGLSSMDVDELRRSFMEDLAADETMSKAVEKIYASPSGDLDWERAIAIDDGAADRRAAAMAKKTKACYICPECHSKVWGKQGLLLKCMSSGCNKIMEADS